SWGPKPLEGKGEFWPPIAHWEREFQVGAAPLAGENGGFVLHCNQGSGILRERPAFAGAKQGCSPVADANGQPAGEGGGAANESEPVVIKKYANRRLYNTAASSYVTLDHLSDMVREG